MMAKYGDYTVGLKQRFYGKGNLIEAREFGEMVSVKLSEGEQEMSIDYSILPEHTRGGMQRYIEHGIRPGDFLYLILCNDFINALCHADQINMARIVDYAKFLYLEAPSACWGSAEKVDAWIKAHESKGKEPAPPEKGE